ncbi:metal-dependent hydrolase [Halorussus sp. MSC15.2]|uniref:metal-dependent hydrolase n=1 Tax=Halorussus sp. MSC15.2 TaxID=2283638 RepID=UPI0013D89C46|nr:metal-dependent hydrolase [Halorussus sp. MSC15.2]NEU57015.1 metal-dependent hydrolase [Halorussus sp. MSC15.2]
MFPPGHYGMALALYAVVGYGLLSRGYERDALSGGGIVLAYTLFPDLDGQFEFLVHRGVTHTLWFALAVGVFCVLVVASSLRHRPRREAIRGALWAFFLGSSAVVAHLLADVINPWGVMPFYPVSSALYSLDVVRATNDTANYAMLAAGVGIATVTWLAARPRRSRPSLARRLYRRFRDREPVAE